MRGVVVPRNSTRSSFLIFSACLDVNESTRCWSNLWEESGFDLSPSGEIVGNKKFAPPKKTKIQSADGLKCLNFRNLGSFENIKYVGECEAKGVVALPVAMYLEDKSEGRLIRRFIIFLSEEIAIGWRLEVGQKEFVLPEKTPTWIANILLAQGSKASLKRPEVRKAIDMAHASFKQREKSEDWSQQFTDDTAQKLIDSSFPLTAATTLPLKTAQLSEKSSAETPRSDTAKSANSVTDAWVAVYTIESDQGNDARAIYTRAESKDKALENFREHFSKNKPWLRNIKYDVIKCESGWGANFNFRVNRSSDYGANEADGISCGAVDPQSAIQAAYAECKKRDSRCGQPGANFGQNANITISTFKVGGAPRNVNNKKTNTDDVSIISEESDFFIFISMYTENFFHSRNSDYSLSEGDSRNIFQYMKNLGFPVR